MASTISVQSLISEKCSSHAWLSAISTTVRPRRPRISRLVRASPRTSATLPIRNTDDVDAALQQRARDDETVAAVVAAAAQDGHLALGEIAVDGFDRRHDLPAGVLHQHERRNADLFDRPAVGFAHLCRVQDPAHSNRSRLSLHHKEAGPSFSSERHAPDLKVGPYVEV